MDAADPRVDAYIDRLPGWQQDVCRRVRDLAHRADPAVSETVKRGDQPYFVLQGNVCALLAARDWVTVLLHSAALEDLAGVITGGHENTTGRSIRLHRDDVLDEAAFVGLLRQVIAVNQAGRPTPPRAARAVPELPPEIRLALQERGLLDAFQARPDYQRRHWPAWSGPPSGPRPGRAGWRACSTS